MRDSLTTHGNKFRGEGMRQILLFAVVRPEKPLKNLAWLSEHLTARFPVATKNRVALPRGVD
jgi:hypothetical protein